MVKTIQMEFHLKNELLRHISESLNVRVKLITSVSSIATIVIANPLRLACTLQNQQKRSPCT